MWARNHIHCYTLHSAPVCAQLVQIRLKILSLVRSQTVTIFTAFVYVRQTAPAANLRVGL